MSTTTTRKASAINDERTTSKTIDLATAPHTETPALSSYSERRAELKAITARKRSAVERAELTALDSVDALVIASDKGARALDLLCVAVIATGSKTQVLKDTISRIRATGVRVSWSEGSMPVYASQARKLAHKLAGEEGTKADQLARGGKLLADMIEATGKGIRALYVIEFPKADTPPATSPVTTEPGDDTSPRIKSADELVAEAVALLTRAAEMIGAQRSPLDAASVTAINAATKRLGTNHAAAVASRKAKTNKGSRAA